MSDAIIVISEGRRCDPKIYYRADLKDILLENLFHSYFMINSEMVDVWNKTIKSKYQNLNDDYFYHYSMPIFMEQEEIKKFCNKWLCYDLQGNITTLKEYKNFLVNCQRQISYDNCYLQNFKYFN